MECLLRYASLFISLDACCWRYCLFPEPWLKTLKFLNSPSAQTARIFTRLSQWFFTGNNQNLNNSHLRLDELFSEGSCFPVFYFQSGRALDAAVLRCCLFPAHFRHFATSIETRVVVVQSCA